MVEGGNTRDLEIVSYSLVKCPLIQKERWKQFSCKGEFSLFKSEITYNVANSSRTSSPSNPFNTNLFIHPNPPFEDRQFPEVCIFKFGRDKCGCKRCVQSPPIERTQ